MDYENLCISCFGEMVDGSCPQCGYMESGNRKKTMLPARILLNGRYLVGEVLGLDKSAVNYKAWDTKQNKIVEIQEYFPRDLVNREKDSANLEVVSQDLSEEYFKSVNTIKNNAEKMFEFSSSENIINIFDSFEENNTVYIVSEYLEGMLLGDYVEGCGGKLSSEEAVSIISSVLDGLALIHKAGLVHRAVTPKNIILTTTNKIKIINFRSLRESSPYKDNKLTVYFSPGYAPPEQYRSSSKQGPFSDIYSVGAVLYKILTGQKPVDSLNRISVDELVAPNELNPEISDAVNLSIIKAMNVVPELRFKNASDFKNCLLAKKEIVSVDSQLADIKEKNSRNFIYAVIGAIGVAAGILLYFIIN